MPKLVRMGGRKQEIEELQRELAQARQRVAALEQDLRDSRTRDPLTGLPLLGTVIRSLGVEIERSRRHGAALTVAVFDVDGFRAINAHHGRTIGDKVLIAIGKTIDEVTRPSDLVSRSGADEFVVMMPETSAPEALQAFERILRELEAAKVEDVDLLSVSVGLAQWERPLTPEDLLAAAAQRVESARSQGGGRAVVTDPPTEAGELEASDVQEDVVVALGEALLERDRYTGEHSESVVKLVEKVALGLALGAREISYVKAAALLHDIGKVATPDDVLNKPGPLDGEEWEVMREHPMVGERILRAIPGMGPIAHIVRHEHERFDGGGYPDGLSGDQIPIGARIILACDAYHAMTSDRPYRKAMTHAEAVRELAEGAGGQFDPTVTEMLIGCLYGERQSGGGRTEAETASGAGGVV